MSDTWSRIRTASHCYKHDSLLRLEPSTGTAGSYNTTAPVCMWCCRPSARRIADWWSQYTVEFRTEMGGRLCSWNTPCLRTESNCASSRSGPSTRCNSDKWCLKAGCSFVRYNCRYRRCHMKNNLGRWWLWAVATGMTSRGCTVTHPGKRHPTSPKRVWTGTVTCCSTLAAASRLCCTQK